MKHGYGEYGALKMISSLAFREWTSKEPEPPPADAAPVVNVDADIPVGWVQQMNDWEEQSTSTTGYAPVERYIGVQFLENETVREYVPQEGSDHQRYVWRYMQPQQEYPWYRERGWDEEWRKGMQTDGAVSHVNEGMPFGFIGAEGSVSALPEDCWLVFALPED